MYPHTAPLVTCLTKIYHPNIDLEGKVCLNILRDGWKPVLGASPVHSHSHSHAPCPQTASTAVAAIAKAWCFFSR